jgi:hypothetical protein
MPVLKHISFTLSMMLVCATSFAQQAVTSIEVFYYDNSKGAYTVPYTLISNHFQKSSSIPKGNCTSKICNEIVLIKASEPLKEARFESCNFVIRYKDENEKMRTIGFDNQSNIIYTENKSYVAPKRLLRMIKRRCLGHWS